MVYPKIIFRTDGNSTIGLGHIMRCIALSQMLKKDFNNIAFVLKEPSGSISEVIKREGIQLVSLVEEEEFFSTLSGDEIVVLDGYHFDTSYQKKVKSMGSLLVCIDDLYEIHFVADLIINHAPNISADRYSAESYTRLLLGPEYCLLRQAFLRQAAIKREIEKIEDVFICFGGADIKNLSIPVLKIVRECFNKGKISIVTGAAYNYRRELMDALAEDPDRIIHLDNINEDQMISCLLAHQLAVVPASGILLEALATKCIVISGYYVDNQRDLYYGFLKAKAIIGCDDFNETKLKDALFSAQTTTPMNEIIDGKSGIRLRREFVDLYLRKNVSFRFANEKDCFQYFEWVNEKSVRLNSVNNEPVSWTTHEAWFKRKLDSNDTKLYIFHVQGTPAGQVRVEFSDAVWTINYSVDESFRGYGVGSLICKQAVEEIRKFSNSRINAHVKKENIASIRVFEKLNFKVDEERNGYVYFSLM
jgi:UDP-2,4-diacetamido-2,4,6-trideoxy-beta-L-altropyranose hydrolase